MRLSFLAWHRRTFSGGKTDSGSLHVSTNSPPEAAMDGGGQGSDVRSLVDPLLPRTVGSAVLTGGNAAAR